MGKFMRKSKGNGEVAIMEVSQVGVRTRARSRTLAIMEEEEEEQSKRTKLSNLDNSSHIQLRSRRKLIITPEKPQSSDQIQASRCSSNGSSELVNESLRSVLDLKQDSHDFRNSPCRERTPSGGDSNDLESSGRHSEANSCHKSMAEKMPTDSEIEDFFSQVEKEEKRRFAEKYNFDIEKDEPLEGRFEWIEVKP